MHNNRVTKYAGDARNLEAHSGKLGKNTDELADNTLEFEANADDVVAHSGILGKDTNELVANSDELEANTDAVVIHPGKLEGSSGCLVTYLGELVEPHTQPLPKRGEELGRNVNLVWRPEVPRLGDLGGRSKI